MSQSKQAYSKASKCFFLSFCLFRFDFLEFFLFLIPWIFPSHVNVFIESVSLCFITLKSVHLFRDHFGTKKNL
jgi:hypothetical protein